MSGCRGMRTDNVVADTILSKDCSEASIVVTNVSKSYGRVKALDGVSLSVRRGERFGLIGPDGSGKTSLFRIMATLLLPDKGRATVEGYDTVKDMRAIRSIVGYMPGKFSLYEDLTVEENLNFFATLFGTTLEEGYDTIKDIYGQIERFRHRRAGALSGGMKQKLALSCALVHQPRVLFLDEPTTGVDPVSRKDLWNMLGQLEERHHHCKAATPYLDEIRRCQRVAHLSEGQLRDVGTPDDILREFSDNLYAHSISRDRTSPSSQQSAKVISVKHLVKAFGSFHAVDDISFDVYRGEIFGFRCQQRQVRAQPCTSLRDSTGRRWRGGGG